MNAPLKAFGPIKAVIFDMDGLLLDTEGIYTEVTSIIAGRYGRTFDWSVKQVLNVAEGDKERDLAAFLQHRLSSGLQLPYSPRERVFWHLIHQLEFWPDCTLREDKLLRRNIQDCICYLKGHGVAPPNCVGVRP